MEDIRFTELKFLTALAAGKIQYFCHFDPDQVKAFSPRPGMYAEMVAALIEDLHVQFDRVELQLLVSQLRGELSPTFQRNWAPSPERDNPRQGVLSALSGSNAPQLRITYRGLRRIEELRDLLRRDRILEPFGVLLDKRYFRRDLDEALLRVVDAPVS